MPHLIIAIGGFLGFISVALGAFAAHGLKDKLTPELLSAFQTGTQYQMYHALVLILVGLLVKTSGLSTLWLTISAWLFVAGVVLFSGSLYALALTQIKLFGPVTPLGGLCFLLGWACLFVAACKFN